MIKVRFSSSGLWHTKSNKGEVLQTPEMFISYKKCAKLVESLRCSSLKSRPRRSNKFDNWLKN